MYSVTPDKDSIDSTSRSTVEITVPFLRQSAEIRSTVFLQNMDINTDKSRKAIMITQAL